jgi:hypothetical protein
LNNVPSPKFLPEKDDVFLVSKIHDEGCGAVHHRNESEAGQINTASIEPNPDAAPSILYGTARFALR